MFTRSPKMTSSTPTLPIQKDDVFNSESFRARFEADEIFRKFVLNSIKQDLDLSFELLNKFGTTVKPGENVTKLIARTVQYEELKKRDLELKIKFAIDYSIEVENFKKAEDDFINSLQTLLSKKEKEEEKKYSPAFPPPPYGIKDTFSTPLGKEKTSTPAPIPPRGGGGGGSDVSSSSYADDVKFHKDHEKLLSLFPPEKSGKKFVEELVKDMLEADAEMSTSTQCPCSSCRLKQEMKEFNNEVEEEKKKKKQQPIDTTPRYDKDRKNGSFTFDVGLITPDRAPQFASFRVFFISNGELICPTSELIQVIGCLVRDSLFSDNEIFSVGQNPTDKNHEIMIYGKDDSEMVFSGSVLLSNPSQSARIKRTMKKAEFEKRYFGVDPTKKETKEEVDDEKKKKIEEVKRSMNGFKWGITYNGLHRKFKILLGKDELYRVRLMSVIARLIFDSFKTDAEEIGIGNLFLNMKRVEEIDNEVEREVLRSILLTPIHRDGKIEENELFSVFGEDGLLLFTGDICVSDPTKSARLRRVMKKAEFEKRYFEIDDQKKTEELHQVVMEEIHQRFNSFQVKDNGEEEEEKKKEQEEYGGDDDDDDDVVKVEDVFECAACGS